jgi:uncharacterized protein YjbI with pentapeptide repeats
MSDLSGADLEGCMLEHTNFGSRDAYMTNYRVAVFAAG